LIARKKSKKMKGNTPPIITSDTARTLLDGYNQISLDLGISQVEVESNAGGVHFDNLFLDNETLRKISQKKDSAFFITSRGVFQVAIHDKHYFKLVPTRGAPTLEIDGIRMHRTSDTTPDYDARAKLSSMGLVKGTIFDTCTGLGYTALEAQKRGASLVVTVELQPSVIRIAQMNPWSRGLFEGDIIHKVLGDSYYIADSFPGEFFNYVLHDPPRHRQAGKLYSEVFYRKLFRVMRQGGMMFHYTGEPRSRYRGVNFRKGVAKRLGAAGFTSIVYHPDSRGFTCTKGSV
jgi:predicted methyltransferase